MAVYRLYPEADSFITSFKSESNAGIDEIVELASFPNKILKGESSRILVKFKHTEIVSTLDNIVGNAFSSSINYSLANATENVGIKPGIALLITLSPALISKFLSIIL